MYPRLPVIVSSGYQRTGLGDENVSGSEHYGQRSAAYDDAPKYAGAFFLDCGFKHDDCFLAFYDEADGHWLAFRENGRDWRLLARGGDVPGRCGVFEVGNSSCFLQLEGDCFCRQDMLNHLVI